MEDAVNPNRYLLHRLWARIQDWASMFELALFRRTSAHTLMTNIGERWMTKNGSNPTDKNSITDQFQKLIAYGVWNDKASFPNLTF